VFLAGTSSLKLTFFWHLCWPRHVGWESLKAWESYTGPPLL